MTPAYRSLICLACGKSYSGFYRRDRRTCPECSKARKDMQTLESKNRTRARQGKAPVNTDTFIHCGKKCKFYVWCCVHVWTGDVLPCLPATMAAIDCRADMTIDPLSRNKSYVEMRA